MGAILNFLSNFISITGKMIVDTFIVAIIGFAAFCISWDTAGEYGNSSGERKFIHWLVRIPVFIILVYLAKGVAYIIGLF